MPNLAKIYTLDALMVGHKALRRRFFNGFTSLVVVTDTSNGSQLQFQVGPGYSNTVLMLYAQRKKGNSLKGGEAKTMGIKEGYKSRPSLVRKMAVKVD